jgi:hypothetical protein
MKNSGLRLIAAAFALVLVASPALAQRTFVERPGASIGVRHAGDWRAENSLRNLNRELREAQLIAYRTAAPRARARLDRIARLTDRLNYDYNQRRTRSLVIHRRAEALRDEVRAIRSGLRGRGIWRWR